MYQAGGGQNLVEKLWVEIIEGASVVRRKAVMLDGRSLICDIAVTTTTFIFSSTMSSPKRPTALMDRAVAKQRKCGVCGKLGHNR
jgi:hypothetical protein